MAGSAGTDVGDAGAVINLGGHLLNQRLDRVVGGLGATGHHARPLQGTLGPPGDPHADVAKTLTFQLGNPALGVGVEGVAPINQQVSLLQEWGDRSNGVINRLTGLHHHQNAARALKKTHEFLQGFGSHNLFTRSQSHQELLGFGIGAVVNSTGKTIALSIEDEILAHNAQTNQAEMRLAHLERLLSVGSVWQRWAPDGKRVTGWPQSCEQLLALGSSPGARSPCHWQWSHS